MRSLDSPTLAALGARRLIIRHFFWITPRDSVTGAQVAAVGFWNDVGAVTLNVVDGVSGSTVSRSYSGSGKAIKFEPIVLATGIGVRTTSVELNMIDAAINNLVRGYNLRKAPAERHIGLFDPSSRLVVSQLYPVFVGFVNGAPITTPAVGAGGSVKLQLVSHSRELTRVSTEKCSDASQQKRVSGDRLFQYTGIAGAMTLYWGESKGTATTTAQAVTASQTGRGRIPFL